MDSSEASAFYPMSTNPSGYLVSSDLNGYASEQYVQDYTSGFVDSSYVTDYVTSQTSGKQDTLTFGYTDDKISSINSSAIYSTGGGGTTYSAGQGIDIASNTISLKYDTEGLLTTENLLSTSYPDTVFAEVDHFKQNGTFHNLWSISNYMVDDRTYTVKLAAHHNADYQQGDGYAVSKSSTSMTWNMMLLMMGYMWNNDGYIDLSQGWDYEDGAEEERWEYDNISNCQLQITDDVTGDVYYSDDFSSNELWAFGASDGKLKLKIDKGYEGAILLWNETEQKWYADRLPEIPETISHRVLIANGSNNTADWTSNTITVTPASHSENWNGNLDIQNFDLTNTFKMLCSCSFVGDIQATSNATTTGTVVVKNRDGETLSLQVNVRQISNYSSANDLTTVQFVTDEYSIPFEATLYGEDAANYGYLYSVSFTFDGLQSGGTALSPEDYGMYVITNTWHV
jgi:hypothetical protein